MAQRVFDPTTGTTVDRPAEEAQQGFLAGKYQLVPGTEVALEDAEGRFHARYKAEDIPTILTEAKGALRFASDAALARHDAEQRPVQAFAEAFVNEAAPIPGAVDLGLIHGAGADAAAMKARRETTAGAWGSGLGMAASLFTGGAEVKALTAGGKLAAHLLPGVALDVAARAATKHADDVLGDVIKNEALRHATASGLGAATVGAGVGGMYALDEAALGDHQVSAEEILFGLGAGGLVGGVVGSGIGAITRAFGRPRVDGRKVVGGAAEVPPGEMSPEQLAAAMEAMGQEVDEVGNIKWFPRLMAKVSSRVTGSDERDILRVLSPKGQEILLKGQRAKDTATRDLGSLLDKLEQHGAEFDVDAARLSRTVLDRIPTQQGDLAITNAAEAFGEAREGLKALVRDAANYGRTPEQMTGVLRPLAERIERAERRILSEVRGADRIAAELGDPPTPMPGRSYVATKAIDPAELAAGKLTTVKGVSADTKIATPFNERFVIEAPAQGTRVRYDDPDAVMANGMAVFRRIQGEELGAERIAERLLNDVKVPKAFRKYGMPKVDPATVNSVDDLARQVAAHWEAKGSKPVRDEQVAAAIRESLSNRLGALSSEAESLVDGLAVPRDATRIYDRKLRRWLTVDEFVEAGGNPQVSPVDDLAKRAIPVSDKAVRTAYEELDQVWRVVRAQERKIKPLISESAGLADLRDRLRNRLQDEGVWGAAARAHRELTDRAGAVAAAREDLNRHIPFRDGKADRAALERFTNSLERVRNDDRVDALNRWVAAQRALAESAATHLDGAGSYARRGRELTTEHVQVYKQLAQDVMTLNAQDRLLAANRAQGSVPLFWMGAALSAAGMGHAGYMAGAAVANTLVNPGRAAMQIASLAAFKRQVGQHVRGRISRLVGGDKPVLKLRTTTTIPRLAAKMMTGTPAERREAFRERAGELGRLSDPTAYMDHVTPQVGEIADGMPNHAYAMTTQGQQILAFLHARLPGPLVGTTPQLATTLRALRGGKPSAATLPDDASIRQFGELDAMAAYPLMVFDLAERGILRAIHVEAMRTMFPHMAESIRQGIMEELPALKKPPTPKQLRSIELFLGEGGADKARQRLQQDLYAEEEAATSQAGTTHAPGNQQASRGAQALMTATDRLEVTP